MLDTGFPLPSNINDRVALADWAELSLLLSGQVHLARVELRSAVLNSGLTEEDVSVAVDLLAREVARRARLGGTSYPFRVQEGGISISSEADRTAYVFLLLLSVSAPLRTDKRYDEVEALFDSVVLDALMRYLGQSSEGLRFGTPADSGRPTRFLDAIEWLADRLGLPLGPATHKPPKKNDGGADVVVWRRFRDGRTGFITILGQCTIQIDWRGKAKDIVDDLWRGWIDFGKSPTTCLAIPFVVPIGFGKWDEVRRTVVIVLDRIRLIELLDGGTPSRRTLIEKWLRRELARIKQ